MSVRGVGRVAAATALAVAAIAVASAAVWPQPRGTDASAAPCTASPSWGTPHPELVPALLALVNQDREARGLAPLTISPQLAASADWKARHMAAFGYLDDDDPAPPVRRTLGDRLFECGYAGSAASEILGLGHTDAASLLSDWLGVADLRADLENPDYAVTGIAVADDGSGSLYWVEDLGAATSAPAQQAHCEVPSLQGQTLTRATSTLRRAGCSLGKVSFRPFRRARRGRVVTQAPRAGRTLPARGRVDVVVSQGRERSETAGRP
jgi:uncharacterized protein YkwD